MANEKGNAGNIALTNFERGLTNRLTMNNHNPNQPKFQPVSTSARRSLLDSTKLSRLPERKPFTMPNLDNNPPSAVVVVCDGCGGRLDAGDNFQQSIHGCRKCIGIYTRIDAAIDAASKRKRQAILEKYAAEVKGR